MINRRRFLTISAAAGAGLAGMAVAKEAPTVWRGRAFGAEAHISLLGNQALASQALDAALDTVRRLEAYFSLYDPASLLSVLNRDGLLSMPPEFARLMNLVDRVNDQTNGLFDPTVQPYFLAKLKDASYDQKRPFNWQNVRRKGVQISFDRPGMALTFNGIAQGFATDRVSEVLAAHGFEYIMVNIGEYRIGADAVLLDVKDLEGNAFESLRVTNAAIATSSSHGFVFPDGSGHILSASDKQHRSVWKTVSVVAETAALADGFSTALMLSPDIELANSLVSKKLVQKVIFQSLDDKVLQVPHE